MPLDTLARAPNFTKLHQCARNSSDPELFVLAATATSNAYRRHTHLHEGLLFPRISEELDLRCFKIGDPERERGEWTGDAIIEKSVREYLMTVFPGKSPREIFVRPSY